MQGFMGRRSQKMQVKRSEKKINPEKSGDLFFWFMGLMEKRLPIYLAAVFVSSAGQALLRVANAWIVESVVTAAQEKSTQGLAFQIMWRFTAFVLGWCIWRAGIIRYNIEAKRGIARLEKMIFSKALRLPYGYYENHHSGDFMSRLLFDTERAGDIYGSRFRRLAAAVLAVTVYLIQMFWYSPELAACLILLGLMTFAVNGVFLQPMKRVGQELSKKNASMQEQLNNILAGIELAKLFPAGARMLGAYQAQNAACFQVQKKTNRLNALLESLNTLFQLLASVAFLGLGVFFAGTGRVSLGALTAIYTIYGSFKYSLMDIGKYIPQLTNNIANVGKLYEFLQYGEEPERLCVAETVGEQGGGAMVAGERKDASAAAGTTTCVPEEDDMVSDVDVNGKAQVIAARLEKISFAYEGGRQLFSDFDLRVSEGKCVAITGESGRGKSTLAKLLLGFYPMQSGRIEVAGCNSDTCPISGLREKIAYVPQEPYLFGVSIAENIAYGKSSVYPEDVPMEEIIAAAKIANAHEFIQKLPEGYQTIPGERGNTLSGGERQRIAIARAVIRNAPIFLLDEATSALDNESERLVNDALNRACKGRTTVMIAHRESTIAMADEVVAI